MLDTSKKPPPSLGAELPKAWLGVATQVVTPDVATALGAKDLKGFRVTQVYPGTEASKAGLKVGDRIRRIGIEGGTPQMDEIVWTWPLEAPGTRVSMEIERDKRRFPAEIELAAQKPGR